MSVRDEVNLQIGDYVETKNVYLEDVKGTVTAINLHTFVIDGCTHNAQVVPKRFFNIGFDKAGNPNKHDYFVPAKKKKINRNGSVLHDKHF